MERRTNVWVLDVVLGASMESTWMERRTNVWVLDVVLGASMESIVDGETN